MSAMRVLVCGGRNYSDWREVSDRLRLIHDGRGIAVLIHGCSTGADTIAAKWASLAGVPESGFAAEWDIHGRAAGPIRNQRMLTEGKPDVVIAFPGGKGTADMVSKARAAGVPVVEVASL